MISMRLTIFTFAFFRRLYQTPRATRKIKPPIIGSAATSMIHDSFVPSSLSSLAEVVASVEKCSVDCCVVDTLVDRLVVDTLVDRLVVDTS